MKIFHSIASNQLLLFKIRRPIEERMRISIRFSLWTKWWTSNRVNKFDIHRFPFWSRWNEVNAVFTWKTWFHNFHENVTKYKLIWKHHFVFNLTTITLRFDRIHGSSSTKNVQLKTFRWVSTVLAETIKTSSTTNRPLIVEPPNTETYVLHVSYNYNQSTHEQNRQFQATDIQPAPMHFHMVT